MKIKRNTSVKSRRIPFYLDSFIQFVSSMLYPVVTLSVLLPALLVVSTQTWAASFTATLDTAQRLNLASQPTWLKLLHYEHNGKQSEVLTDDFFLAANGRNDPNAELIATINAYYSPWSANPNKDPRCRFPARYFWLSQHLSLSDYELREPRCQQLEQWALLDNVRSISVFLVSGYFGNPASTFGHGLLKLNTDSTDDKSGLFDLTINFGALVPENENTALYIARGLFGGYQAGFSDKYFYTHDLVYSRTEFRDIWDYRLLLSDYERTLLILHVWEIIGKKFVYYFLDENCVYRLAELLNLVIEEELLSSARFWYAPVELFQRLHEIDEARQKSGRRLIHSVRFIPSKQRELYQQVTLLSPEELKAFNTIIQAGPDSMALQLSGLSAEEQIRVIDSLLAYQQYQSAAEEHGPSLESREATKQALLARLRLPAQSVPRLEIPELSSPAQGSPPMSYGVSVARETNEKYFLRLNWSPYKQELVGNNSRKEDELVVFDFAIGLSDGKKKIFIDQLDFIRIRKLNTTTVDIAGENKWSWQLRLGAARTEDDGQKRLDWVAGFGAGRAWKWNQSLTYYGMIDLGAHTFSPFLRLRPHLGVIVDVKAIRARLYFGAESVNYNADFRGIWGAQIQYQLSKHYAIRADLSNETATRATLGLNWYR